MTPEAKEHLDMPDDSSALKFLKNEHFLGEGLQLSLLKSVERIKGTFKNEKTGEFPNALLFTFINAQGVEQTYENQSKNGKRLLKAMVEAHIQLNEAMLIKSEQIDDYNWSFAVTKGVQPTQTPTTQPTQTPEPSTPVNPDQVPF